MGAFRECIAGLYKYDYLLNILGLLVYVIVGFLIALIGVKGKRFEAFIERKIEEQDVIG